MGSQLPISNGPSLFLVPPKPKPAIHSDASCVSTEAERRKLVPIIFRAVIAINIVRFALSFLPASEGSAGWINSVLGSCVVSGWRIDLWWVAVSTPLIFFAGFGFLGREEMNRQAYLDAFLCFVWTLCFFVFIYNLMRIGSH